LPAQVAELLGVCRASAYRLIETGELAATRVGSLYRVPEAAVAALLANGARR
jgi:excisionase family DNA binding protein